MDKYIKENVYLLLSSIGCNGFDGQVCKIFREIGFKKVGVSILGGMIVNIDNTISSIRRNGFDHYCGDIPDVNWNWYRIKYDWEMVNRNQPEKFSIDLYYDYLKRMVLQMIVWRFFSVRNGKSLQTKIDELISSTVSVSGKKWIRWDSRGLQENLDLVKEMPEKTNVIVEYYPESHHPNEFVIFIKKLNTEYKRINFWISFDAGHFHRARYLYRDCLEMSCEYWLMKYLQDSGIARLIKMIEISNLPQDGQNAHHSLYEGVVDFQKIFTMIGWAMRNKLVELPFFVVVEATPLAKKEIMEKSDDCFTKFFGYTNSDQKFNELKVRYNM